MLYFCDGYELAGVYNPHGREPLRMSVGDFQIGLMMWEDPP